MLPGSPSARETIAQHSSEGNFHIDNQNQRPNCLKMKSLFLPLLLVCSLASGAPNSGYQPVPLEQGASAPDFSLTGVDGKTYRLEDFSGGTATVVIFTTNHCPDAIASIDRMIALVDQFEKRGVKFVAINSNSPEGLHLPELGWTVYNDGFEDMKRIAEDSKFNLPYLYDGDTQEVAKAYGAVATPHLFIFDSKLQLRYNGRMDDGRRSLGPAKKNEARDALTSLLDGKEPATIKTRPIGCTIKWKEKSGKVAIANEQWKKNPVTVELATTDTIAKLVANEGRSGMRLFNIWSTSCGPCVLEFPDLAKIYRQYSWQSFEFIPISLDPSSEKATVAQFLEQHECGLAPRTKPLVTKDGRTTNNYLFEGDPEELANALDPEWNGALPHTLLVGPNGKILFRHTGMIEPLALKKAIVAQVWAKPE